MSVFLAVMLGYLVARTIELVITMLVLKNRVKRAKAKAEAQREEMKSLFEGFVASQEEAGEREGVEG